MQRILICAVALFMILAVSGYAQEAGTNEVDRLALKVEKIVKELADRQSQLEQSLSQLEQRLDNISELLGDNFERGSRFETMDQRLREVEQSLERLERR